MNHNLDEQKITEAIESYPLSSLPEGFVKNVMAEIQPRLNLKPKNLEDPTSRFLNYAILLFFTAFSVTVLILFKTRRSYIDPLTLNHLHTLIEYWLLRLSLIKISPRLLIIVFSSVFTFFLLILWQLTDPNRQFHTKA